MELTEHRCHRCGAELTQQSDTRWKCRYCGCSYDDNTAVQNTKNMREMFDEAKQETINNLRRNLYDATNAEYISSADVKNACVELKKYLPDDFRANFFEVAVSHNEKKLTQAIRKIDTEAHYEDIENIVTFLIKSLQPDFLLELNNLIERAFKNKDLVLFEKYATEISVQAEKVQLGVYETKLPREVFVAYSSKDMDKVSELVEFLEGQGLKCFVAARNLRHGKGSVENYDKALKEAIDHCKSFVFVSTTNSRSFSCDALEIEIPYVQKKDTENAPAEYRNNYAAIPHKFKKPRVEYRVESSKGFNAADEITKEFFDGYEWVLSPNEVAVRIMKQLVATPEVAQTPRQESKANKKYCMNCGEETDKKQNFCSNCGKSDFVDDISDFIKLKNQREIEERRRYEEEQKKAAAAAIAKAQAEAAAKVDAANKAEAAAKARADAAAKAEAAAKAQAAKSSQTSSPYSSSTYSSPASKSSYTKKKSKKGVVIGIIVAIIAFSVFIGIVNSIDEAVNPPSPEEEVNGEIYMEGDVAKGTWDNFSFSVTSDGVMTITGSGDLPSSAELQNSGLSFYNLPYTVTEVIVEEGITSVGNELFSGYSEIKSVKLAKSVTKIGTDAFSNSGVVTVEAYGVTEICDSAFDNCYFLQTASFEELQKVGSAAFNYCTSLVNFRAPKLQTIEVGAFKSCENLTFIELPEISTIEAEAFYDCYKLERVNAGANITYISDNAFTNTAFRNSLSSDNPLIIGDCLYRVSTETSGVYEIPDGIEYIADGALCSCTYITGIMVPTSVKAIGKNAFADTYYNQAIIYAGDESQWNSISFGENWNGNIGAETESGTYNLTFLNGSYDPSQKEDYTWGLIFTLTQYEGSDYYIITGYNGSDSSVVIPSSYLSIPVAGINNEAFYNSAITDVYIPASVQAIGHHAFYNCDSLTTVAFGENSTLSSIDISAFASCEALTKIAIPASVTTLGTNVFDGCSSLSDLTFEAGSKLTCIPESAFSHNAITSLSIPDSITEIHNGAFYSNETLAELSFGENSALKSIGSNAFRGCEALTELSLPQGVETVEDYAFGDCPNIASATVPTSAIGKFTKNALKTLVINGGEEIPAEAFFNLDTLETLVIGDTVTFIAASAFNNCDVLTSVTFGASVSSTGENAFKACQALTDIQLNQNLETIGTGTFIGCSALKSIVIPESVKTISANAFYQCTALEQANLPAALTTLEKGAFQECTALSGIVIPTTITKIPQYAFYKTALTAVEIPSNIVELESYAFAECKTLETLIIPESVVTINSYAFSGTSNIKYVTMPSTAISYIVGASKTSLREVTLTSGDIAQSAFNGCSSLVSIKLHENLQTINAYAFQDCISLLSVEIPASVQVLADTAFKGCYRVAEIINRTDMQDTAVADYFENELIVHKGESLVKVVDDFAFITVDTGTYLLSYLGDMTDIVLPEKYEESTYIVRTYSFYKRKDLTSVQILGAEKIESHAFHECDNITSLKLSDNVLVLDEYAFGSCDSLETVDLGKGIQSIGHRAFYYCNSLQTVNIPGTVNEIGIEAFYSCSSLAGIIFKDGGTFNLYNSSDVLQSNTVTVDSANGSANATLLKSDYRSYRWVRVVDETV